MTFGQTSFYPSYHEPSSIYSLQEIENPGEVYNLIGAYHVIGGITAGQTSTLTADCSTLSGLGTCPGADLELFYADANGNPLQIVETSTSTYFLPPATDTCHTISVTGTVPEGTVCLVPFLAFIMDGSQTSTVNLYWDNASLVLVPEPYSLVLFGMGLVIPLCLRRWQNS